MRTLVDRLSQAFLCFGISGSFIKSFGAVSILRLSGGLLLYISQVLLASWMGPYAFGSYSFAWAWVAILGTVAGLGLGGTSVRYIAAYRANEAEAKNRGFQKFGRTTTFLSSLFITVIALAVVEAFLPSSPYRDPLLLALCAIPALSFLNLEAAYARGFQWMALGTIGGQIGRPAFLILIASIVAAFTDSSNAEPYVIACIMAYALAACVQHLVVRRRIGGALGPGPRDYSQREWLWFAMAMLLLNGSQVVRANTDLIMVGVYLLPDDLGTYTAAVRTSTLVAFVLSVTSVVAQPTISALYTQGRQSELGRYVAQVTLWIFVLTTLVGLSVAAFGPLILGLFGSEFEAGYPALLILITGLALVAPFGPITSLLTMTGQHYPAAAIHTSSIAVNIGLNALLIPPFGIEGAAVATALSLCLTNIGLLVVARRALEFAYLSPKMWKRALFGERA